MLNLKRFDRAVWFDYPGDKDVKLKIRPFTRKATLECMARSAWKIGADWRDPAYQGFSNPYFLYEWFSYCLEEWKGIRFGDEENIGRDGALENIFQDDGISLFVRDKSQDLVLQEEKALEDELKNSRPSQGG